MNKRKMAALMVGLSALFLTAATTASPVFAQTLAAQQGAPQDFAALGEGDLLLIDTDFGTNSARGLLNDDSQALFMLTQAGIDILGITTVSGNTWTEEGAAYALRQLERVGRSDIPVYQGLDEPLMGSRQAVIAAEKELFGNRLRGAWDHDQPADYQNLAEDRVPYQGYAKTSIQAGSAPDFIAEQIKAHPNQVTILAIGPLTNIAVAIKNHPEIVPLTKQIIYMGGAFDVPGNVSPAAEFNVWFDPEATRIVWSAPWPKQVIVPLDVTESVRYGMAEYERIITGGDTTITNQFKEVQAPRFEKNPKVTNPIPDIIPVGVLLEPSVITRYSRRLVTVETGYGHDYGRTLGYMDDFAPAGLQMATIIESFDNARFFDLAIKLFTAPIAQN